MSIVSIGGYLWLSMKILFRSVYVKVIRELYKANGRDHRLNLTTLVFSLLGNDTNLFAKHSFIYLHSPCPYPWKQNKMKNSELIEIITN